MQDGADPALGPRGVGVGHPVRLLELFCGVGGFRVALQHYAHMSIDEQRSVAVDFNDITLRIFQANFPGARTAKWNLASVPFKALEDYEVWTLSPPCQPFSRQGRQRDVQDTRSNALSHLTQALRVIEKPPELLILENVANFEKSEAFAEIERVLHSRSFDLFPYLLNPYDMGFPNSRLRFFLVAVSGRRRKSSFMSDDEPHHQANNKPRTFPLQTSLGLQEGDLAEFLRKSFPLDSNFLDKKAEEVVSSKNGPECALSLDLTHCDFRNYDFSAIPSENAGKSEEAAVRGWCPHKLPPPCRATVHSRRGPQFRIGRKKKRCCVAVPHGGAAANAKGAEPGRGI